MHFYAFDPSVLDRDGLTRAAGTTGQPHRVRGVLRDGAAAGHPRRLPRRARRAVGRAFWWTCVGLIGAGLMFSVSRSAILGVTGAGLVLLIGWPARRRVWMAVSGARLPRGDQARLTRAAQHLPQPLPERRHRTAASQWRTHDYATARSSSPSTCSSGRGIGTWYAPKHEVFDNQYLLTLVDSGVIGLVAFLGIFLAAVYAAVRVQYLCYRLPEATETRWRTATSRFRSRLRLSSSSRPSRPSTSPRSRR